MRGQAFGAARVRAADSVVPDPSLAAAIRETLHLLPDTALTAAHMQGLRSLENTGGRGIKSLAGLELAPNLVMLIADRNLISDLTPLAGLSQLTNLGLGENQIRDIGPLAGLTRLRKLDLRQNQITDLSPLANLIQLEELNLTHNRIQDLSPLLTPGRSLPRGSTLLLRGNPLDLNPGSPAAQAIRALHQQGVQVYVRSDGPTPPYPAYADDNLLPATEPQAPDAGPNPPAAERATLLRNPDDGSLLLYGGHSGGDITAEFWRYRSETSRWEPIAAPGTTVRGRHSAVWDPGRHEMIVYGGVDNLEEDTSDLLAYSPAQNRWRQVQPGATDPWPRARKDHTAVWDPVRRQMLLFGGHACPPDAKGVAVTDELWAWHPDRQRWELLHPAGPLPASRHGHSSVWDPVGERMLVFGGSDFVSELPFNDVWSYDPKANTWTQLDGNDPEPHNRKPEPRERHRAVWDTVKGRMLFFGGCCGPASVMNDFWAYYPQTNTWQRIETQGARPTARELYGLTWDPVHGEMLLYGGWSQCWPLGDLWSYRSAENQWQQLDRRPAGELPAREGHTAVWDAAGDQMLIYGGCDNSRQRGEIFAYHPASNSFERLAPAGDAPRPRDLHVAAFDPARRQMLVFGGYGLWNTLNDLWAYDVAKNRWQRLTESGGEVDPPDRYYGAAVWDTGHGQMIFLGGRAHNEIPDTLWAYRPATGEWISLGKAPMGGRDWQRAVWDENRKRLLAFGGWTVDPAGAGHWPQKHWQHDLWGFDPETGKWEQLPSDPPIAPEALARYQDQMYNRFILLPQAGVAVWDPIRQQWLMFGGFGHEFDATWHAYSTFTNAWWAYTPATGTWRRLQPVGPLPPGRTRSAGVWNSRRNQLLIYGGFNSDLGVLNDLWAYDPATNRWTELHPTLKEPKPAGARQIQLAVGSTQAQVDGVPTSLEVPPYLKDGRALVPVRFIAEALGLKVGWDAASQTVTLTGQTADGGATLAVIITLGASVATVNGEQHPLAVPAELSGGRTFLPLRFVAETFGLKVEWDPDTGTIRLTRPGG